MKSECRGFLTNRCIFKSVELKKMNPDRNVFFNVKIASALFTYFLGQNQQNL